MADVYEELQGMIGSEEGPFESAYEINRAMIFHWCKAMDDRNPLYINEDYARNSRYGGIIAPPPAAQAFRETPWPEPEVKAAKPGYQDSVMEKLHKAGYTQTVATTNGWEFFHPLRIGDRIRIKRRLASISPEKKTRTGVGFFVTNEQIYVNQKNEVACVQSFTTLHFKPPQAGKE